MPAQRCPHCGLVNSATARNCDCGYSFLFDEAPKESRKQSRLDALPVSTIRIIVRLALVAVILLGALAIRLCGSAT